MCPESWQDKYDLTQDLLPQSFRKLVLGVLENVEKVLANSNAKEKAAREVVRKPLESATNVSARVLVPTRFESPKR
jgi:hypothetical protein